MAPRPGGGDLVARAAAYARRLHADDVRKGSDASYFDGHLAPVARIVADAGGTPVQVAAAYLHDAAEDHGGERRLAELRRHFGDEVADIVRDLSDSLVDTEAGERKADWRQRKEAYLARLGGEAEASLAVAAADKLHNATAIVEDHERLGDDLWQRFTTGRAEDQRWYYQEIARLLAARLPGHPTVARLQEAVARLVERIDAGG
ncbi:MAG TPA: HD domain-containing protein [Acidimicrobiales bacterium]|nr:HD domain-containing protein [Acidimicrobiales bacterium]